MIINHIPPLIGNMGSYSGKELEIELNAVQHTLFNDKRAVLILFEGVGGSQMSFLINGFTSILEPRGIEYHSFTPDRVHNYLGYTPAKGKIAIFDRSWYSYVIENEITSKDRGKYIESLERYLINSGIILVKIFLHMSEKRMDEVKDSYPVSPSKDCGFLGDEDPSYHRFSLKEDDVSSLIDSTDSKDMPWDVIDVGKFNDTVNEIGNVVLRRLKDSIENDYIPTSSRIVERYDNPRNSVDFSQRLSKSEYKDKLKRYQSRLAALQCKLALSNRSLVLLFEGWDAAGKGGSIKRVTKALNPRGYATYPTSAPNDEERSNTYLWRFARRLPQKGHISIFDRSWYGRMMVEPIEGLCSEKEYSRSADEINMFERNMTNNGRIVIKFWMDITKDVQLERFDDRQNNPMKQWKITDEDWRNREKWDEYESFINTMIESTNTPNAPWYAIESVDKYYGRIKVLKIICDTLEKEL